MPRIPDVLARAVGAVTLVVLAGCGAAAPDEAPTASATSVTPPVPAPTTSAAPVADNPYLPLVVGSTWVYRVTGPGVDGTTVTQRLTTVAPVAGGQRATVVTVVARPGRPEVDVEYEAVVRADGALELPVSALAPAVAGDVSLEYDEATVVLPSTAQLATGEPTVSPLSGRVRAGSFALDFALTATVTPRPAAAVTVPAGSYPGCTVVEPAITGSVSGISADSTVTMSFAPGAGLVASDFTVIGVDGRFRQELESFTPGA